ncbi:NAD dependent epimerase/dehydratase family protein [Pelotomaculum sp. FP]|uniref:NAD-dependent epimerase/dehydratase family protein n=1 Tax=Pelotomaculum sp. FP TaxID=261474 RepID=UPI001065B134|nr:NAD-dependent epimerase/dehydratase family protein [Pelotomaculum sp. FP]TEB16171.1 NAD dependent epimerase/dehydratase family protein [Pelotomaculum sp. FP]
MKALIGYTGFVGSNLCQQTPFDAFYNSKNIQDSYGKSFDLVVYAGVPAEKYLANHQPEKDRKYIDNAIRNIKKIKAKKFILISTIDVYKRSQGVDETTEIEEDGQHPYGLHRRLLEKWVEEFMLDSLIIRLPALYGSKMKKNFIFDMINMIPTMIKEEKFKELLQEKELDLEEYYTYQLNGFYKVNQLSDMQRETLKTYFMNNKFNSLAFTDSRNEYPFYNLKYLWNHIETALANGLKLLNITTEPVSAAEVYAFAYGKPFENIFPGKEPVCYDIKTIHARMFGGENGYIFNKQFILEDIKLFVAGGK